MFIKGVFTVIIFGLLIVFLGTCTPLKIKLDNSGIEDISESILKDFQSGSSEDLENYLKKKDIVYTTDTFPLDTIQIKLRTRWLIKSEGVIQERFTFPSALKRSDGSFDTAVFYLYRKGHLKNQKVILWIPGFGVSDFAFYFIRKFFYQELEAGYSVLFYNIPYHMERIEQGKQSGEGLFTGNIRSNLELIRIALREIKTMVVYLQQEGISSLSGWGGSIGASLLWLSSATVKYDHMTLMIPIVDWKTIIFNPGLSDVIRLTNQSGFSNDLIRRAYNRINPYAYPSRTKEERIQILYAKYDQLTPKSRILDFVHKNRISNVHVYEESHASILINSQVYRDNFDFLKSLEN